MTREKIIDKALKLVESANKATTFKKLDMVAQAMVLLYIFIAPDQRPGLDELMRATLLKVMRIYEVTSMTIEASKALPPAAVLKLARRTRGFSASARSSPTTRRRSTWHSHRLRAPRGPMRQWRCRGRTRSPFCTSSRNLPGSPTCSSRKSTWERALKGHHCDS